MTHLIRVMRRHGLTKKNDNDKYKIKDKDNDKDKYILKTPSKSNPRDLWPFRHLIRMMMRVDMTNNDIDNDKDIQKTDAHNC